MWKEFKEFAMRGNVVDMAVGIIIGAAFGTIARSLVDDVIMPPIGLVLGNIDFSNLFLLIKEGETVPPPYHTVEEVKAAGAVSINYGRFINNIVSFIIVAFAVFMMVKGLNTLHRKKKDIPPDAPTNKECPYCYSTIPLKATKCAHCTSELKG